MSEQESSKKTYSSKFIFFWITVSLAAMTGFMFICQEMGVLNPRQNWDMEFTELSKLILEFHRDESQQNFLLTDADFEGSVKKYAGSQFELRKNVERFPVYTDKMFLNRKQFSMLKFANSVNPKSDDKMFSFGIFPIAKRQLKKTFKFAQGSFLWHAYTFDEEANYIEVTQVKSTAVDAGQKRLNLVAANYMNDYFIIVVSRESHDKMVTELISALSLYHSDFIRTL